MVTASFFGRGAAYIGFKVQGHSGYAPAGQDIVCAAVSAMTMLTVNMLESAFGVASSLDVDEETGTIRFSVKEASEVADKVIGSFRDELLALMAEYPQNILVKE